MIPGYLKQLNEWGLCLQTVQSYNSNFSPRIKRYRLNIIDYLVVIDSHLHVTNAKQIEKQIDNALWNSLSFVTIIMRPFNCYNEAEDSFVYNKWIYEMAELISVLFALAGICLFMFGKYNFGVVFHYFTISHFTPKLFLFCPNNFFSATNPILTQNSFIKNMHYFYIKI